MARVTVSRFLGIAPKVSPHLLDNSQAQVARNAKLWSQGLRPLSGPGVGSALDKSGTLKTIFRYDDDWLCWTQEVNVARAPVNDDDLRKIYFTGTDLPRVTTIDLWDDASPGTNKPPASWILGIPAPTTAPTISDGGAGNITATVQYVYTFARKYTDGWVEESAPSPVSNELTVAGKIVDVGDMDIAPMSDEADYGVTHVRIYRTEGEEFFFVDEIAIGSIASTYSDNAFTVELGDAINTTGDLPWPDDLVGIVTLANGCLAGFVDKSVYISEPKKPHAYRLTNVYAVAFPIVGLGVIGSTIIAITSGSPEIGRGVDPAQYSFRKNAGNFPCTSARSIASADLGVLWSTPRGMALSDGSTVDLATSPFITKEEWAEFSPDTIHGVVHDGRYFGWFTNGQDEDGTLTGGGFVLDKSEAAFLTQMGDYVYAAHVVPEDDDLFFVKKEPRAGLANYVYKFEADPTNPIAYEWKSKKYITPGLENFAFCQVLANYGAGLSPEQIAAIQDQITATGVFNAAIAELDGAVNDLAINECPICGDTMTLEAPSEDYIVGSVTFQYWGDGTLIFTAEVSNQDPVPMPAGNAYLTHEFQVSGALQVDRVKLVSAVEELAVE